MTNADEGGNTKKVKFRMNEKCVYESYIYTCCRDDNQIKIIRILLINSSGVFILKELILNKLVVTVLAMVTQALVAAHEKRRQTCFGMTAGGGGGYS